MNPTEDHFRGAFVGLALGDALGAPHEGGPIERLLWRVIGSAREGRLRFTDDTQMALDLAESLLSCGDINQDDLAARFSRSYRWNRGYGPSAARMLKRIRAGVPWRDASRSFEALLEFAAHAGGDVDTVGAMAGALWGARNGFASLPASAVGSIEGASRSSRPSSTQLLGPRPPRSGTAADCAWCGRDETSGNVARRAAG